MIGVVTLISHQQPTSEDVLPMGTENEDYVIGRLFLKTTTEDRSVGDSLVNGAIMVCFTFFSS